MAIRPGLATPGPSSLVMTMKEPRWKTRSAGPSALPALPDTVTIGKTYSCAYHFVNNMETVITSPLTITKEADSDFTFDDHATNEYLQPGQAASVRIMVTPSKTGTTTLHLTMNYYNDQVLVPAQNITATNLDVLTAASGRAGPRLLARSGAASVALHLEPTESPVSATYAMSARGIAHGRNTASSAVHDVDGAPGPASWRSSRGYRHRRATIV